jgi:hypothetical protein
MLRVLICAAVPLVLLITACSYWSTPVIQPLQPDTVTVARAYHSVTVARIEDSVTVVVIAERGLGVDNMHATYESGPMYQIWVTRGQTTVTSIPWHPGGLSFNRSEQVQVEPGDVLVLRYPEDLTGAGLLSRRR